MTFGLTFNLGVHLGVKVILQVHCIAAHLQEKMTHTISCLFMFISKKSKGGVHLQSAFKLKLTEKIKHSFLSSCKGVRKILLSVCLR